MKFPIWAVISIVLFSIAGAIFEDHVWPEKEPYCFVGFTLFGFVLGILLQARYEIKKGFE